MDNGDGILTPNRSTTLTLDVADPVLVDAGVTGARVGSEVAKDKTDFGAGIGEALAAIADPRISNVRYWPSGVWTLAPKQIEVTNIHEYIDTAQVIIPLSGFRLINLLTGTAMIAIINAWRQNSDLPGMTYNNALINATGDPFFVKQIPAGQSWAGTAMPSATPVIPTTTVDIPLDRCGESTATYAADQGFFLRWTLPGTSRHHPNYIWSFYFGQYAVTLKGNGTAVLWEYCHDYTGTLVWRKRDDFRYNSAPVGNNTQTLLIWPVKTRSGERVIHFEGGKPDGAGYLGSLLFGDNGQPVAPNSHTYKVDEVTRGGDMDESPGSVTKAGIIRFDIRRDLKLEFQISTLGFETEGILYDLPLHVADATHSQGVTITGMSAIPSGQTLMPSIRDGDTGDDYTSGVTVGPSVTFDLPTSVKRPSVAWTFQGDGHSTPLLYGYTWRRQPTAETGNATPFSVGVNQVQVSGYAGDPSEQSAEVNYEGDLTGANKKLSRRGLFAANLTTTYTPPGGDPVNVSLLRGYVYRPQGQSAGRRGNVFPSPDWFRYGLPMVGMYFRLQKRLHKGLMKSFLLDPDAIGFQPYKVTTAIAEMLKDAGFPDDYINIGPGTAYDLDIRLWHGTVSHVADTQIEPMTNYAEMIKKLAQDYLGAHLWWDDQNSYWTLIFAPAKDSGGEYIPLFQFQKQTDFYRTAGYTLVPPTHPNVWSATQAPILGEFGTRPIPPEWNAVTVTCPVQYGTTPNQTIQVPAVLRNHNSYQVPGSSVVPDPEGPDYLGTEFMLTVVDLGCTGGSDLAGNVIATTYNNCRFKARRLFDFVCHGQQLYPFVAPLVFIQDAVTGSYRPLRYLDPVKVEVEGTLTTALIRSCSPGYESDFNQLALYEAIVPRTGC